MFYVKEKLNGRIELNVAITSSNVYCQCPVCGKEHSVKLSDIFANQKDVDMESVLVLCDRCAKDFWRLKGK